MKLLVMGLLKLLKALFLVLLIWFPLIVPIGVVALLLGVGGYWLWKSQKQRLDEQETWSLIMDFERSRALALRSDPKIAAKMLDVIAHHPARLANGPLFLIAERERARDVHDVIDYLRKRTGEDLGDDPNRGGSTNTRFDPGRR